MWQAGLVGKPNTGKSTFFSAATLVDVKIAPYPFTTIEANKGIAYVRIKCVCKEFGVRDNPVNSVCIDGNRFIPVELIDVAGLVPDAWKGRGLGNQFLDELRRADVLIHVIDASGSTDIEGRPVKMGEHDPLEDVKFLERELNMWIMGILKKDWQKISKKATMLGEDVVEILANRLSGLGIETVSVKKAIESADLSGKRLDSWSEKDLYLFIDLLRHYSKPMLIAANKADLPTAEDNIKRLKKELKDYIIIPTSAESELALRKAASKGLIKYIPGDDDFEEIGPLTESQKKALKYIRENVLEKWGSTGVQQVINEAFLKLLKLVAVFPVENENKLSDKQGRILPDVFLLPYGSTAKDLAYRIHTELGEKFMHAIDVRTRKKLSADYILKHRDVLKIVTRR